MRRMAVGMLTMLGVALGLVGCGSDDDRLSQEEFVTQGNAICQSMNDRLDAKFEQFEKDAAETEPTEDDVVAFLTESVIPEVEGQINDLDKLNPPKAVEDDFNGALTEARKALETVKDDPAAAANSDDDPFDKADELIGKAGLDVCAEDDE